MQLREIEFKTTGHATPVLFFSDSVEASECFRFKQQKIRMTVPKFNAEVVDLSVITDKEVISALENQLHNLVGHVPVEEDSVVESGSSD